MGRLFETGSPIAVPRHVSGKVERLTASMDLSTLPKPLAEDIWACRGCIKTHQDRTEKGNVTYGIVIYCPTAFKITYRKFTTDWLKVGTPFLMDGRQEHSLELRSKLDNQVIAFMAWDIAHDYTIQGFLKQAIPSLEHWSVRS